MVELDMKDTWMTGDLAYVETAHGGMIKCRVLGRFYRHVDQISVDEMVVEITARSHPQYKRGERVTVKVDRVHRRGDVYTRNGHYRVMTREHTAELLRPMGYFAAMNTYYYDTIAENYGL